MMGQRKKGNKFFRWMRPSELPPQSDQLSNHLDSNPPPPGSTSTFPPKASRSSPEPFAPRSRPQSPVIRRLARPTSIALSNTDYGRSINDKAFGNRSETVVLRVKQLSASQCVGQTTLKHIPGKPDAISDKSTQNTANEVDSHVVVLSAAEPKNVPDHRPASARNATVSVGQALHLTQIVSDQSFFLGKPTNSKLASIAESRPAPPQSKKNSRKALSEKKISCRLYDCILPAGCTTRNASSEPPESRTPSVVKLDLGHLRTSSSSIISRSAQLSKKKFLLEVMDRSVDSIGSCSLDVDAESTDFSDTSGSLNLCTPSSGKDFTREFTSRIHERCQIGQIACQKSTTILDPASGKIKTVLSSTTEETPPASPAKKPSYLNLACCVNGYSNLTTYDSKLRQNINKSREVSPIRPIIHTLQYNRGETNGQYLVVPVPMPIVNDSKTNCTSAGNLPTMDTSKSTKMMASPDKRYYSVHTTSSIKTTNSTIEMSKDTTDNISYLKSASTTGGMGAAARNEPDSPKSFIQQRVERLYGPSALAAGFYSPKRSMTDSSSVLSERSQNSSNTSIQTKIIKTEIRNGSTTVTESENLSQYYEMVGTAPDGDDHALPVLRHLRPEFRAQLLVSPKRSQPKTEFVATTATAATTNGETKSSTPPTRTPSTIVKPSVEDLSSSSTHNSNGHANKYAANNSHNQQPDAVLTSQQEPPATQVSRQPAESDGTSSLSSNGTSRASNGIALLESSTEAAEEEDSVNTSVHRMKITDDTMFMVEAGATPHQAKTNGCNGGGSLVGEQASTAEALLVANATPAGPHTTASSSSTTNGVKNGLFFLTVLNAERDRLIALAVTAESYMDTLSTIPDTDEEIFGHLRSAAGKARLLAAQKIRQFEGLCHNNLNQVPGEKFPTTDEDLQGFWDMVMLQVDHVDKLFHEIEAYRANSWQKLPVETKQAPPGGSKITKRPMGRGGVNLPKVNGASTGEAAAKKSAVALAMAQRREAQRQQLLELKRRNKKVSTSDVLDGALFTVVAPAHTNGSESVEIFGTTTANHPTSS